MNKKEILKTKIEVLRTMLKEKEPSKAIEEEQKKHPEIINPIYKEVRSQKLR